MVTTFTNITPNIKSIFLYTWGNSRIRNRFKFSKRDILVSKISVKEVLVYKDSKQKIGSQPDQKLIIQSWSAPQYPPYRKKNSTIKQLKIKHTYPITIVLQRDNTGEYTYNSRIKWRTGSFRKYIPHPPQNKIKSVYKETREKLKIKYSKDHKKYLSEINKIRIRGRYLNVGDWNAQNQEVMLDSYFRDQYLQKKFNCLYGPLYQDQQIENKNEPNIKYVFADKHLIFVILYLMKKGYIKYNQTFFNMRK